MIRAAGILFLAPKNQALYLKRGPGSDYPGYWCFPGGRQEGDETIIECAIREAEEETGVKVPGTPTPWTRQVAPYGGATLQTLPGEPAAGEEVDYTTFVVQVPQPFVPVPDAEHVGYAWAPADQAPQPLHPGCAVALDRFGMDELGVARAIADGRLASPQRYENVTLFALRITGTGAAYRTKWKEYVWRDPSLYMNDEFLARCNGLPVIMMHPEKKPTIDSDEFADRIVGMILLPYLKPEANEVWGIAKIYDDAAIKMMTDGQMSTSPAVVFRDPDVNVKVELESGEKLLIEGKPSLLDHLAICEHGVWDKGGEPTGVLNSGKDQTDMTEEEKRAAEAKARKDAEDARARADAESGQKLDKLLTGLDSIAERMTKQDAEIAELKKSRDDDAKKRKDDDDARKRKDDDDAARAKKDDDESVAKYSERKDDDDDDTFKKRHDAEEESEAKERMAKGEAKEVAADKAKKHRKDADEKEAKAYADRKARKDSQVTRADIDEIKRRLPRQVSEEERRALALAQAGADRVFQAFGDSASRPQDGESLNQYRRRLATQLKVHSSTWKDVDIASIADDAAFGPIERQIYADAQSAASMPADLKEGEIRYITRTDHQTGVRMTTAHGRNSFVRQFKRAPRGRVTRFLIKGRQSA